MRTVNQVYRAQKVNMGGIILDQALPLRGINMVDPFLLIHHWANKLPGGQQQNELGVGPHPHRGFSPVTLIFKGGVHHRDSTGVESIIYGGGTQWMNSGKGIIHSERPYKELSEKGGDFELIQFWMNAPKKHKFDEPSYQPLSHEDTPKIISDDKKVTVGLVAGELLGKKGLITSNSQVLIARILMEKGGKMNVPVLKHFNALVYQLDGTLLINNTVEIGNKEMVTYNNDGDYIELEAKEACRLILLSGEPINEPVATYGPFVMNTEQELNDAIRDYQSGKMGKLIEKFD